MLCVLQLCLFAELLDLGRVLRVLELPKLSPFLQVDVNSRSEMRTCPGKTCTPLAAALASANHSDPRLTLDVAFALLDAGADAAVLLPSGLQAASVMVCCLLFFVSVCVRLCLTRLCAARSCCGRA